MPEGVLYDGVHVLLGEALLLVGGVPLATLRVAMALLLLLSPLMFYMAALQFFANGAAAVYGAVIYALSGTVWFPGVFDAGLWPNFFGILVS